MLTSPELPERLAPKPGLMWPLTLLYLNTPGLMEKLESMERALFLLACGQPEALIEKRQISL